MQVVSQELGPGPRPHASTPLLCSCQGHGLAGLVWRDLGHRQEVSGPRTTWKGSVCNIWRGFSGHEKRSSDWSCLGRLGELVLGDAGLCCGRCRQTCIKSWDGGRAGIGPGHCGQHSLFGSPDSESRVFRSNSRHLASTVSTEQRLSLESRTLWRPLKDPLIYHKI